MIRSCEMKKFSILLLAISFLLNGQQVLAESKTKYRAFKPSKGGDSVFLKSGS